MQLIAISASVDYRVEERDGIPAVEFSWSGSCSPARARWPGGSR
jgi:hypothetical protein